MDSTLSQQGETLDRIAFRIYGSTDMVPALLKANKRIAALGPVLPMGTSITLPPAQAKTAAAPISLW